MSVMQPDTDKQSTFDFVTKALLEQGVPSMDPDGVTCLYRGPNGTKCAAGHLIPDELYRPDLNSLSARGDLVGGIIDELGYDRQLVIDLQRAHDRAAARYDFVNPWTNDPEPEYLKRLRKNLTIVADRHGLSTAALQD